MQNSTNAHEVNWEELLPKLLAYTHRLVTGLSWFRGKGTTTFIKGKELEDYVHEAIAEYLEKPEKFKPEKNKSLEKFLCFSIIRRLVWNDVNSKENVTTKKLVPVSDDEEEDSNCIEDLFLRIEATFDQNIDYDMVIEYIEENIKGDSVLENIYLGRCHFGMKRGEIITDFNMESSDYDNGVRRLSTVLRTAATIFQLKSQHR